MCGNSYHQQLESLATLKHALDILHHDVLHLVNLLFHFRNFVRIAVIREIVLDNKYILIILIFYYFSDIIPKVHNTTHFHI